MILSSMEEKRARFKEKDYGVSTLGTKKQERVLQNRKAYIKKHKIVMGTKQRALFPTELVLPFNPFDLEDKRFSKANPWRSPEAVDSTVEQIKYEMSKVPELHELFAGMLGIKPEEYDISMPAKKEEAIKLGSNISVNDFLLFSRYVKFLHYSMLCFKASLTEFLPYSKKFISKTEWDDNGQLVTKDLAYNMFELEQDLFKQKQAVIDESYKPGGAKEKQGKKEHEDEIALAKSARKISYPYYVGVMRYTCFEIDKETRLPYDPETKIALTEKEILDVIEDGQYYLGAQKDFLEAMNVILDEYLKDMIFKKDYTKSLNYVEVDIDYLVKSPLGNMPAIAVSAKEKQIKEDVSIRINTLSSKFDDAWRESRNDIQKYSEEVMVKSVTDFTFIDDKDLLAKYKKDLDGYSDVITATMITNHKDLISKVNAQLSSDLLDKASDLLLPEGVASDKDKKIDDLLLNIADTNPAYGISVIDNDDSLDLTLIDDAELKDK